MCLRLASRPAAAVAAPAAVAAAAPLHAVQLHVASCLRTLLLHIVASQLLLANHCSGVNMALLLHAAAAVCLLQMSNVVVI